MHCCVVFKYTGLHSNSLRHPDCPAPPDVKDASLIVWIGQGNGGFARNVGCTVVPVNVSGDVVVVVVFHPFGVGVGGEEGGENEGVGHEGDVLWDKEMVAVVEDNHGDDGCNQDQDGKAQDHDGLPVGCHFCDEEEKNE